VNPLSTSALFEEFLAQLEHASFQARGRGPFRRLPNFFCSADAAPGLVEELWKFAKSAYLDSPLPDHAGE
jgi:hypothetical protein